VNPIVTEGISTDSPSFHEEFFGPVFNLYQASNSEEALSMANNSDYGLAGTICSEDTDKALEIASRL